MGLIDTHTHIHSSDYTLDVATVMQNAIRNNVVKLICVGTSAPDSMLAIRFAQQHQNCWASVGLHPHDAQLGEAPLQEIQSYSKAEKVIAIGECGLDYYYNRSPKADQEKALRKQLEIGLEADLPFIFHVRDAFDDFWRIIDGYQGVRGVIHSFTAGQAELDAILSRRLYVGLNGIVTFTRDEKQLAAARSCPQESMVLETDAPFLTPKPKRGTVNEPANVALTVAFLAELRQESLEQLSSVTTSNATTLFGL